MAFVLPVKIGKGRSIIYCAYKPCGVKFYQNKETQKYCSTECRLMDHYSHKIVVSVYDSEVGDFVRKPASSCLAEPLRRSENAS